MDEATTQVETEERQTVNRRNIAKVPAPYDEGSSSKTCTMQTPVDHNGVDDRKMHVWRAAAMKGWADVHVKEELEGQRQRVGCPSDMRSRGQKRCPFDDAARN